MHVAALADHYLAAKERPVDEGGVAEDDRQHEDRADQGEAWLAGTAGASTTVIDGGTR